MSNKYQEALDNVKIAPSFMGGNVKYSTNLNSATPFSEDISILQELVDKTKTSTLEELIKEWEDDSFKFEKIFCYQLINKKEGTEIYFDNDERGLWCHINGHLISKQLIRLILTFVALGWEVL